MEHERLGFEVFACKECFGGGLLPDLADCRVRNRSLAYRFLPPSVELLFIAESPPVSGAYFYRLPEYAVRGVPSALFWEVVRALGIVTYGEARLYERKEEYLREFAARGLFIVDAAKCPVNKIADGKAERIIRTCARFLRREVSALDPKHIVLIKKTNRVLVDLLHDWGFSARLLSYDPLAFPVAGNQGRFRSEVARLRERYPELRKQLGEACRPTDLPPG